MQRNSKEGPQRPYSPDDKRPQSVRSDQLTDSPSTSFYSSDKMPPVTPGIHTSGRSAYIDHDAPSREGIVASPAPIEAKEGTTWNANSSFAPQNDSDRVTSPTDAAKGAQSGEELLRRLSLIGDSKAPGEPPELDPASAHPTLNLSGRIISATFVVPYNIGYAPGCDWVSLPYHETSYYVYSNFVIGSSFPSWHVCSLRFFFLSRFGRIAVESYACCLDWGVQRTTRNQSSISGSRDTGSTTPVESLSEHNESRRTVEQGFRAHSR